MLLLIVLCLTPFLGASAYHLPTPVDVAQTWNITTNGTSTLQQYPFVVQVDSYSWQTHAWTQSCSGTVLNSRNVLSAASCFDAAMVDRRVRAGANYRNTAGRLHYIERLSYYNRNATDGNDIVIVRLRLPLAISDVIRQGPIIASNATIPARLVLNQLGWGSSNNSFVGLSSAQVTLSTASANHTLPTNATAAVLTATPSVRALVNGDIGSPWVYGNVTIGVLTGVYRAVNGSWFDTLLAASVTAYTNWIVRTAV